MKNKKRFRKIDFISRQSSKFQIYSASSKFYFPIDNFGIIEPVTILSQAGFHECDSVDIAQQIFIESLKDKLTPSYLHESVYKKSNSFDYLYVYDIDDVNELTIEEVRIVWENRCSLCGSIEVAAEILSILRYLDNDEDEPLYSYINYLDSEEIISLADNINKIQPYSSQTLNASVEKEQFEIGKALFTQKSALGNESCSINEGNPEASLNEIWIDTIEAIATLNDEHLKYIWRNVLDHCETIEIASALYAKLRFIQGYDKVERGWLFYINSPSVSQFKDKLPSYNKVNQFNVASALSVNKKEKSFKYITTRTNQTDFRTSLINRYSGICCITRCSELTILEAAHIIPYMGGHSNLIDNGLLLRVDIHRLFDRYLITIDSDTHKLLISDKITDEYYRSLGGKEVYIPKASDVFLKKHNFEYKKYN